MNIITSQYTSEIPIDLVLERTVFKSRSLFDVKDVSGNLVFKVRNRLFSWLRETVVILDAGGSPIATIRQKNSAFSVKWRVYKGESIRKIDSIFYVKQHSIFSMKTRLDVFLANNTYKKECDFLINQTSWSKDSNIFSGSKEDLNALVAEIRGEKTVRNFFLGQNKLSCKISPKVDQAFIVALYVILEESTKPSSHGGEHDGAPPADTSGVSF